VINCKWLPYLQTSFLQAQVPSAEQSIERITSFEQTKESVAIATFAQVSYRARKPTNQATRPEKNQSSLARIPTSSIATHLSKRILG
jgi:hypothetical protein